MEMPSQPDNTSFPAAPDRTQFPVVGIGASAGGVTALTTFFAHMPPDSNMAFVVVMHFPPEAESNLASIVQRHTAMPVLRITEQIPLRPNQIYIISPQSQLVFADGTLSLAAVEATNGAYMPIDQCLRALAEAYADRSAAIILSSTGSDGVNGIKRIKEAGGVTLVQDPQDAEFSGMPHMTLNTGLVDFVLPAAALPEMLITYWQRESAIETPAHAADADVLREIFAMLRLRTGHDFSHYKRPTMWRRLARRMQVTGTTDLPAYLALLRSQPHEVQALLQNLLISVTNFFRDRDAWGTLQTFIPQLFANKGPEDQVRVWVTACATGEEAYSVAMLLCEFADTLERPPAIQVFATDIDDDAISIARQGVYPDSITGDVSPKRLARFFIADQSGYRVKQELRDLVIFARHNVLHDPPFSLVDLITCRNLLIYLNREAQEQVIQTFHFALRPQGLLLLGSAESLDDTLALFTILDKGHRVFQRRPRPTTPAAIASSSTPLLASLPGIPERAQPVASFADLHQQLISPYIPPSLIVSADGEIVHLGRGVGPFLHFGEGEPSHNLLKIVQPDLRLDLRSALFRAREHDQPADVRRTQMEIDGETRLVNVIVEPITEPQWARGHLLVMFQDVGIAHPATHERSSHAETLIMRLEAELAHANSQLRTIAEQYETVVEEYKAANEELHAINQELRVASEELETSKAEVQSINEELTTVNQELKLKVEEVSCAHNDLQNLITSTQIATLFLDRDLRIKRFTPSAQQIFNLIPTDLGRPLDHVTHTLLYDRLRQDAAQVLHTSATISREIETRDETWSLMHVNPYRTVDDHVDGVVLTFIDITEHKRAEEALRASEEQFRRYVTASSDIVYKMSADWSEMRYLGGKNFIASTEQPTHTWLQTYIPDVSQPQVLSAIQEAIRTKQTFELEHPVMRLDGSVGWIFSRAIPVLDAQGKIVEWFGAASDVTARKQTEIALRESEENFRLMADAVPQIVWLTDADGRTEFFNKQWTLYTGAAYEPTTAAKVAASFVHPDDGRMTIEAFNEARRAGSPFTVEHRIRSAAGTYRWFLVRAEPYRDPQTGTISRWFGASIDIHDHKQAEEALRKSDERFRALLAKGTDMITISDREGAILYASPSTERVSGYTTAEFQGSNPFRDAIHPDDIALCRTAMERLSATPGLSLTLQHRARHKSGDWHWYEGTFTSLFHEPAIGGLVANVRDITERKQAEAALAQAYNAEQAARAAAEAALKTRDQFLSIASHELRTPLTSLIGFVYMLPRLANQGPEALSAMTARIMRQAQRLNALIDQLLDVSRLQRGQFVVERQLVDIGAIVAQVVEEFRATQSPNSKHLIELQQPQQPLMVAGDTPRLEQVLANLLTNAVKYSPAGGLVRVLVAATTTEAVIEVIDQGIGIPLAAQTQLFEPFYRAGNVGSQTSGFGLGLHIVREIVERHGGRIEVDSAENQGSTFRVMLPRIAKTGIA